ncbi:disulfide bond formation protein B [Marinicella sp. S1101]|uniref:disulfide bond formation protein B n=1 Tax=Marinicella marina TaxID=2996016 RepID=UPI002260D94C|nr:disulfide bond formation protein B [Marinicella marina]MCX7555114.1 disulfide bond formation protein B [Marinicella marina]MDJ1140323.1 disulfide bond formation protein B [Marinicella marina]
MNKYQQKAQIAYMIVLALMLIPLFGSLLPDPIGSHAAIYMPPFSLTGFILVVIVYVILLSVIAFGQPYRFFTLMPAIGCASLLIYALHVEYVDFLMPCNLCILQRVVFVVIGVLYLLASLKPAKHIGRLISGVLILLASGVGIGIAGRHVWLQNLPPELVPDCGPSLQMMLEDSSIWHAVSSVLSASGSCAEIKWEHWGLSMPTWTLICFIIIFIYTVLWMIVKVQPTQQQ